MLGSLFALLAAATFAWTNAAARRGVVTSGVFPAIALSIPLGVPVFLGALLLTGNPGALLTMPREVALLFAFIGISHFIVGRYCNYRALKAIGANLAGPVLQMNLLVSLFLAIVLVGETLNPVRILGIILVVGGPMLLRRKAQPAPPPAPAASPSVAAKFQPKFAEGYAFAALAAIFYGASPALVRYGVVDRGLTMSLAGGVIAAAASTIVTALLLLWPARLRDTRAVNRETFKWFVSAGLFVYISQVFVYMALALAPASVVAPIIGLANVFRIHLSRWLNPDHEVFGADIILATAVSFLGVIVLSASTDAALSMLPLPEAWMPFLRWHWP